MVRKYAENKSMKIIIGSLIIYGFPIFNSYLEDIKGVFTSIFYFHSNKNRINEILIFVSFINEIDCYVIGYYMINIS